MLEVLGAYRVRVQVDGSQIHDPQDGLPRPPHGNSVTKTRSLDNSDGPRRMSPSSRCGVTVRDGGSEAVRGTTSPGVAPELCPEPQGTSPVAASHDQTNRPRRGSGGRRRPSDRGAAAIDGDDRAGDVAGAG